jgi:hypothetical protein
MAELPYSGAERVIGRRILAWLKELQEDGQELVSDIDRADVFLLASDIAGDLYGATIVRDPGLPPGVVTHQEGKLSEWPGEEEG